MASVSDYSCGQIFVPNERRMTSCRRMTFKGIYDLSLNVMGWVELQCEINLANKVIPNSAGNYIYIYYTINFIYKFSLYEI